MPCSRKKRVLFLSECSVLKFYRSPIKKRASKNVFREKIGEYQTYYLQIKNDVNKFFKYVHMKPTTFRFLLIMVQHKICKKEYYFRRTISSEERLIVTLRYLTTGDSYYKLSQNFKLGYTTVARIIHETCNVIWDCLCEHYMKKPNTQRWLEIADGFQAKYGYPHCIGCLDGMLIPLRTNFNQFEDLSICLQLVVDSADNIMLIDLQQTTDDNLLDKSKRSQIYRQFKKKEMNIPEPKLVPGTDICLPYVLVSIDRYPLLNYIVRPFLKYSQTNLKQREALFNKKTYILAMSMTTVCNLLAKRWQVLCRRIENDAVRTISLIKAICVLHNFTISVNDYFKLYVPRAKTLLNAQPLHAVNHESADGVIVRSQFVDYFYLMEKSKCETSQL